MFRESGKSGRAKQFKKGIDPEESRRRRDEISIKLRKEKREQQLAKRRMRAETKGGNSAQWGQGGGFGSSGMQQGMYQDGDLAEKLKALPELVQQLNSADPQLQHHAVTNFRKLLSIERNPPIQQVIECGVVPRLVHLLKSDGNYNLQFEAAWALTNIASGTSEHTMHVIKNGAVPIFVKLLASPNEDVREQSVWALGNIAGDSCECRDLVLQHNALHPILKLCTQDAKLTMLRNATWTISNFCRGKPQPAFHLVEPALGTLTNLIYVKDYEVLTDACWALSYLSDDTAPDNQKIQAVIESGVCRRLVELLMHKSDNVRTPALRTVGNIVTGDDVQTQVILSCAALPCLRSLLSSGKKSIRKETCWTISNITAGNVRQIEEVKKANLIPSLVEILRNAEFDIKKEAAWAISNATCGGNEDQIRYLVQQGVTAPLCQLLKAPDPKIIMVALEGIENILRVGVKDMPKWNGANKYAEHVEECGGLDLIEDLQRHDNEDIYNKAVNILQMYFDTDENNDKSDDELAPATGGDGSQFQFGFGNNNNNSGFGNNNGGGDTGFNFN
eukprot:CAMPEP_0185257044 /NCGR_PEP_ID=MMETSP1359-20130426/6106_1 /TAXON_ID=552665 /ORGANISM="Bigelowiella longifila, Strain CCMP242" /LENGTH=559 /DNA_ID=CAMNT_0027841925 /DNA_START=24 /DNA_END=1703 /DNA_ORIENTATION=-